VVPVARPNAPVAPPEVTAAANVAPVSAHRELPASDEPRPAPRAEAQLAPAVSYDIMLGVTGDSPQYGLLGDVSGRRVAIDRIVSLAPLLPGVRWRLLTRR
jgi:DNA phosphorothioation-dependent restriction protein DptH